MVFTQRTLYRHIFFDERGLYRTCQAFVSIIYEVVLSNMVQFKEPSDPHGHAVGRAQENLTSTVTDGQLIRDSVQCEDMDQGVSQTVGKIEVRSQNAPGC